MADWLFLAIMGGGAGILAMAARRRAATTHRRTERLGMTPRADLARIPHALQDTVLWTLCEGGTERSVVGGRLSLAAHDIDVTCFDLEDLGRKRFGWAWLDVGAPFRLHTPLSVVACTVDRALPHILIKRAGPADRIEPRAHEHGESRAVGAVAGGGTDLIDAVTTGLVTRAALQIVEFRRTAEAPPPTLGRETLDVAIDGPWRAWASPAAGDDERHLIAAIGHGLDALARDHEIVIELLGPLVLVYAASGGPLDAAGLEDLVDVAAGVCERVLAASPELGPRGVEG